MEIQDAESRLQTREDGGAARGEGRLREKLAAVEAELARRPERAERRSLAQLPGHVLADYERILRARAVSPSCPSSSPTSARACRMTVTPQRLQELRAQNALIACESCGRYLYWQAVNRRLPTRVTIYADGACPGNPGPGGWAAIVIDGGDERELSGGEPATTNQRMELRAALEGLRAVARAAAARRLQRQRLRRQLLPRPLVRALAGERLEERPGEAGREPRPLGGAARRGRAPRRRVAQGGRPQRRPPERAGRSSRRRGDPPHAGGQRAARALTASTRLRLAPKPAPAEGISALGRSPRPRAPAAPPRGRARPRRRGRSSRGAGSRSTRRCRGRTGCCRWRPRASPRR